MHILIDVQGCQSGSRFRGIGRSTLAMSRAIIKNKGNYRVSILLNGMYSLKLIDEVKQAFSDILPLDRMFVFSGNGPIAYIDKNNHIRNTIAAEIRDIAIANICPDIVYVTSFFEGYWDEYIVTVPKKNVPWKTVCVCHDLIPLLDKSFYFSDKLFGTWYMDKLVNYQQSDAILAISHSALNEMLDNTNYPSEKLFYISSGVGDQFQIQQYTIEQKKRLQKIYHMPEKFIMSLATDEPRKNIDALIKAYSGLDAALRQQYPLVLAYNLNEYDMLKFKHLAINNNISSNQLIFTGYLPDEDLVAFYNFCTLFIFPSLHEGFGLPPLEAMKCGAATLGSNTTSLPEVIGYTDATFDPRNIDDIRNKIQLALTDKIFYRKLKDHAMVQATKFSWDNTATLALNSFNSLLSQECIPAIPAKFKIKEFTQSVINDINRWPNVNDMDNLNYAWAIAQNSFQQHRKKILVDISELTQRDDKSGIQRVSRSVLYELLNSNALDYEVRAVYYINGECYRYANYFLQQNYGINFGEDEPVLFSKDDIMLVTDLTISFFPQILPSIENARLAGSHVYFIVHDILPTKNPEWSSNGMQQLFPMWLQSIATYGTGIICVSSSVADDVRAWVKKHHYLNLNMHLSISNFYLGANLESSQPTQGIPTYGKILIETLNQYLSFLMVGTLEPRKSYAQTLSAFELLWAKGKEYRLIIVGKHGWNVDELTKRIRHHPELNKRLYWLQGVSDEFLEKLYKSTTALIFSSRGEGFGLPLVEAAQKGLPLILRDIPIFREIAGDHAFYFSGEKAEYICNAITIWLELNEHHAVPDSSRIHLLTWKQSVELLLSKLPIVQNVEASF